MDNEYMQLKGIAGRRVTMGYHYDTCPFCGHAGSVVVLPGYSIVTSRDVTAKKRCWCQECNTYWSDLWKFDGSVPDNDVYIKTSRYEDMWHGAGWYQMRYGTGLPIKQMLNVKRYTDKAALFADIDRADSMISSLDDAYAYWLGDGTFPDVFVPVDVSCLDGDALKTWSKLERMWKGDWYGDYDDPNECDPRYWVADTCYDDEWTIIDSVSFRIDDKTAGSYDLVATNPGSGPNGLYILTGAETVDLTSNCVLAFDRMVMGTWPNKDDGVCEKVASKAEILKAWVENYLPMDEKEA